MSVRVHTVTLQRDDLAEAEPTQEAVALELQAWNIQVYLFPCPLPGEFASVVTDTNEKTAAIFVANCAHERHDVLVHELAHVAVAELGLEGSLGEGEIERLVEYLARRLR